MAHNRNTSRGQSSNARRRIREEIYLKTVNRKRNHEGCAAKRRKS